MLLPGRRLLAHERRAYADRTVRLEGYGHRVLTADEVLNTRFSASGMFHAGYDAKQVDAWLDLVVSTLRAHQGEAEGDVRLLAEDAHEVRFRLHRGAGSYDTRQVDAAIDHITTTLLEHQA